jgi:surface protein
VVPTFISSWKTDNPGVSANNQVTIPTEASGNYSNIEVEWGDGTSDVNINSWDDPAWTHTYASSGTYTVKIKGVFSGFRFNDGGDKSKLINISNFGILNLGNSNGYFYGCNNLTISATDQLDMAGTTTLQNAFRDCSIFNGWSQIGSLDVSAVTNMNSTFFSCSAFNSNIGSWNVRNATDKASMFENCVVFNQSLNSWDMELTTTLFRFLISCSAYNQRFDSWDLSSCTTLFALVLGTSYNQPLTNLNLTDSLVTDISFMFAFCANFNQPVDHLDFSGITSGFATFNGSPSFDQSMSSLDFSSFTNLTDFLGGVTLSPANYDGLLINLDGQTLQSGVTFSGGNSEYSPGAATDARASIISNDLWTITDGGQVPLEFDVTVVGPGNQFTWEADVAGTHSGTIDWGDLTVEAYTGNMTHSYASPGTYTIKIVGTVEGVRFNNGGDKDLMTEIKRWGNLKPRTDNEMFYGCSNMTITATDKLQLDLMTSATAMFRGCDSIVTIPSINSWDWSGVLSMNGVFQEMDLFNQALDLNTSSCVGFVNWLRDSTSFNSTITLDTTACTDMFALCSGATAYNQAPDFSTDLGNVTRYVDMYGGCVNLDQDFSVLSFASATDCTAMFSGVTLSTSTYDAMLISIDGETLQSSVLFDAGNSKYSAGAAATARSNIISGDSWTILDGGQAP